MAKQKLVMKASTMTCAKMRAKALKTVAGLCGIISITLENDQIVVVGDGIDPVTLMKKLRKKMRFVELVSVAAVEVEGKPKEKPKEGGSEQTPAVWSYPPPPYVHQFQETSRWPACWSIM